MKRRKRNPKKVLWKYFAKYVKQRDKNKCFTCGKIAEGKGMHAGHYIPKSICGLALYFSERNVHAQCYRCNINLGGYGAKYHQQMVKRYGQETVDELWRIKNQVITKDLPYEELIEKYKKMTVKSIN